MILRLVPLLLMASFGQQTDPQGISWMTKSKKAAPVPYTPVEKAKSWRKLTAYTVACFASKRSALCCIFNAKTQMS